MPTPEFENPLKRVNQFIVTVLNMVSNWSLAAMMFLTFLDVLLRYVFNKPISGAGEIIEFLMAIVIPFSIVYCAQHRSHISVDFILERFSGISEKVIQCFNDLLMLILFVPITYQSFIFVNDQLRANLTSPVLYIPVYPFVSMVAIAFLVLSLILLEQVITSFSGVLKLWNR